MVLFIVKREGVGNLIEMEQKILKAKSLQPVVQALFADDIYVICKSN